MADKKDGLSYIDDIPLKISSAFLPPPHIVIPVVPNSNVLMKLEKYDFSFEKKVLEDIDRREKFLDNASKPNTCLNGQEQESNSSLKPAVQNIIPLQSEILLPKPQRTLNKADDKDEQNNSKINLSDFENATSSPFDFVELQTINDFEELSNVFQGLNKSNSGNNVNKDKGGDSTAENNGSINFAKSMSFPLPIIDNKVENSENEDTDVQSSNIWNPSTTPKNCLNFFASTSEDPALSRTIVSSLLHEVPCFPSTTAKIRNAEDDISIFTSPKSKLRGCRSYSDIHDLSEKSLKIPDARPNILQSDPLSKDPLSKDNTSEEINCDNCTLLNFPDPYYELSEESRQFIDAVTGMGFPRDQVSRTVKHLGTDEKTVVEHLCQIQTLEECGYDCLEAEAALHLHDYNQDQAKVFLDLINKFQDLGFEKNAVKKALIQNKNDESKTIDALLS